LSSAASTTYIKPTIYHHTAAAASIQPNITYNSRVEQLFNTPGQTLEEVQPNATEIAAPPTLKQLNLPLVIGMNSSCSCYKIYRKQATSEMVTFW